MRCTYKFPSDDFYCWRYQVWYNSYDCAYRTKFQTSPGCRDCAQGDGNLKRHQARLSNVRWPGAGGPEITDDLEAESVADVIAAALK